MYLRAGEKGDEESVSHAFQLAKVVILCPLLDRAYVIVSDYAVALAERLAPNASAISGWAVKVMTQEQLDTGVRQSVTALRQLDGVDLALAERLSGEGVLSLLDLASIDPAKLGEMAALPVDQAKNLVKQAREKSASGKRGSFEAE
jgi:hypothetical protein